MPDSDKDIEKEWMARARADTNFATIRTQNKVWPGFALLLLFASLVWFPWSHQHQLVRVLEYIYINNLDNFVYYSASTNLLLIFC